MSKKNNFNSRHRYPFDVNRPKLPKHTRKHCEDAKKEKSGFRSKELANSAMWATWNIPDGYKKPAHVYFCGKCAVWHLTSHSQK